MNATTPRPRRHRGLAPPEGCLTLQAAAQELGRPLHRLTEQLRALKVVTADLYPSALAQQRGLLEVRHGQLTTSAGLKKYWFRTFVTRRGMTWLRANLPAETNVEGERRGD